MFHPLAGVGWSASPTGVRGLAPAGMNIRAIARGQSPTDIGFSTDIQLTSPYGVSAALFRTNAAATSGYAAEVDPNAGRLRLLRVSDDATLGTFNTAIMLNKVYRLRVTAIGNRLAVHWQADFLDPDGATPAITATDSTHSFGHGGPWNFRPGGLHQVLCGHRGRQLLGAMELHDGWF